MMEIIEYKLEMYLYKFELEMEFYENINIVRIFFQFEFIKCIKIVISYKINFIYQDT